MEKLKEFVMMVSMMLMLKLPAESYIVILQFWLIDKDKLVMLNHSG
jgi:hypothetical protein